MMQNLIHLVEAHSEKLFQKWLDEVSLHPDTFTFHQFSKVHLLGHVRNVYEHLNEMLRQDHAELVEEVYTKLGAQRFTQGFRLSEVLKAQILARRILWSFLENQGFYSALELRQAMELRHQILSLFDRMEFFTAKGYEEEASVSQKILSHAR